jgi:type IV pilus assembly protein PilA
MDNIKIFMTQKVKIVNRRLTPESRAGFSLLELLVVVALIGILATYAVPTYRHYLEKTRFVEVIQAVHNVRLAQSLCLLQQAGTLLRCDSYSELGLSKPSETTNTHDVSITRISGLITGTGTTAAGSYTYILTPSLDSSKQLSYKISRTCMTGGFCDS